MLTKIGIGNFKAFADLQSIPIRPLTLIYGANSAGKSSIIHALVLMNQALKDGKLNIHRTEVGGDSVDLGGFGQYVHRRNTDARVSWSTEISTEHLTGRLADLLAKVKHLELSLQFGVTKKEVERKVSYFDRETNEVVETTRSELITTGDPTVLTYTISADGEDLFNISKRPSGHFKLDRINVDHKVFSSIVQAIVVMGTTSEVTTDQDVEYVNEIISDLISDLKIKQGKLLPEGFDLSQSSSEGDAPFFALGKGSREKDLKLAAKTYLPRLFNEIVSGLAGLMQQGLGELQYLGPLRSLPPRHIAFSQHHDPNWKAGGGYAWDIVRQIADVREIVNEWLSAPNRLQTPYKLDVRNLLTLEDVGDAYQEVIQKIEDELAMESSDPTAGTPEGEPIMDLFGELYAALGRINDESYSDIQELTLYDERTGTLVSHRDVGIGVSQVLPVLVSAYASAKKIIAIEQPEIHLHPALQADLGDVFIHSALGELNNRFLLESHSEHLLLRVMRRMRETAEGKLPEGIPEVKPSDVAVLFVQPKGKTSVIRHLELAEDGSLLDPWPGGFFEEGFRERFS